MAASEQGTRLRQVLGALGATKRPGLAAGRQLVRQRRPLVRPPSVGASLCRAWPSRAGQAGAGKTTAQSAPLCAFNTRNTVQREFGQSCPSRGAGEAQRTRSDPGERPSAPEFHLHHESTMLWPPQLRIRGATAHPGFLILNASIRSTNSSPYSDPASNLCAR